MKRAGLRSIPSVEKLVQALGDVGLPGPPLWQSFDANSQHYANKAKYPASKACSLAFVPRWEP